MRIKTTVNVVDSPLKSIKKRKEKKKEKLRHLPRQTS